jgi:chromosome segregation ATPase
MSSDYQQNDQYQELLQGMHLNSSVLQELMGSLNLEQITQLRQVLNLIRASGTAAFTLPQ